MTKNFFLFFYYEVERKWIGRKERRIVEARQFGTRQN